MGNAPKKLVGPKFFLKWCYLPCHFHVIAFVPVIPFCEYFTYSR